MRRIRRRALLAIVVLLLAIVAAAWYAANATGDVKSDLNVAYRLDTPRPHNLLDVIYHGKRVRGGRPAIIFIHGGSWRTGDKWVSRLRVAPPFVRAGYVAVSVNYRLSGVASFPAQIEDVKAAIRWLRANADRYNVDPQRIGLWGFSAGAQLAALAGVTSSKDGLEGDGPNRQASSRVQCVVCRSGVYDMRPEANPAASRRPGRMAYLGGPPEKTRQAARKASPIVCLDRDDPPMLIIHGTKDPNIPYAGAQRMAQALRKAGTQHQFVTIQDGGHGGAPTPAQARAIQQATIRFLDEYLKR